jgi:MYXO-CTERM domain-containing protein
LVVVGLLTMGSLIFPCLAFADWAPGYEGPCDETAFSGRECSTDSIGYGHCRVASCDEVDADLPADAGQSSDAGPQQCFICVESPYPGRGCAASGRGMPVAGSFALSVLPLLVVVAIGFYRRRRQG